jgi:hypothetical protein
MSQQVPRRTSAKKRPPLYALETDDPLCYSESVQAEWWESGISSGSCGHTGQSSGKRARGPQGVPRDCKAG